MARSGDRGHLCLPCAAREPGGAGARAGVALAVQMSVGPG